MSDRSPDARTVRVGAVGDFHFDGRHPGRIPEFVGAANEQCDVLVLCGDLTTHGEPDQVGRLLELLEPLEVPAMTVLGNHEYEADAIDEITDMLEEARIPVLDGTALEVEGVGFAGAKGFAGGFGQAALGAFGEPLIKRFVQEGVDEALKLENALRKLGTEVKVVVLHYSPVLDTLVGEPEIIYAYLGTSRLAAPIDQIGADVVFHGHAHTGTHRGETQGGVPVFNVSLPILEQSDRLLHVWEAEVPSTDAEDATGRPRRVR